MQQSNLNERDSQSADVQQTCQRSKVMANDDDDDDDVISRMELVYIEGYFDYNFRQLTILLSPPY